MEEEYAPALKFKSKKGAKIKSFAKDSSIFTFSVWWTLFLFRPLFRGPFS
jgi:hypothetical protein